MSLLRRRMMMQQIVTQQKLFDIESARIYADEWREIEYSVEDGALTITKANYTWSAVKVYLDNCENGKNYNISYKMKTERENRNIRTLLNVDDITAARGDFYSEINADRVVFEFTAGEEQYIYLYWSNATQQTEPITYYDFELIEI